MSRNNVFRLSCDTQRVAVEFHNLKQVSFHAGSLVTRDVLGLTVGLRKIPRPRRGEDQKGHPCEAVSYVWLLRDYKTIGLHGLPFGWTGPVIHSEVTRLLGRL